ncbi:hypothetical protein EDB85DRAFT_2224606 [Lactarius pseudohatsudake]|nr:hypothetical protein EDB85DRAFT_2224606 [Lactarius pseudohatsudake]
MDADPDCLANGSKTFADRPRVPVRRVALVPRHPAFHRIARPGVGRFKFIQSINLLDLTPPFCPHPRGCLKATRKTLSEPARIVALAVGLGERGYCRPLLGHSYSGHRLVSPLRTASLTFALTRSFSRSRSRPFVIAPALAIAIVPGSALSSPLFTSARNPAPPTNSHGLGSVQWDTIYMDTNDDAAAGDTFYHNEEDTKAMLETAMRLPQRGDHDHNDPRNQAMRRQRQLS